MVFSKDDLSLIKILRQEKHYGANRNWFITTLNGLIAKINATGSAEKRYDGGRPRTARTMENVDSVETLILSQEDRPGTHKTICQVSRETGIRELQCIGLSTKSCS